jgi:hypothetical protein
MPGSSPTIEPLAVLSNNSVTMNTVCTRCKLFRSRSVSSQSERTQFVICLPSAGHDAQRVANESICDVTMIDVSITHAHFFDSRKAT